MKWSKKIEVIIKQCEKRNTKLQVSIPFDIANGEVLYISEPSGNNNEWILSQRGKFKIVYQDDFEYWRIFSGLTNEQMIEREDNFEYPPRLQVECRQNGSSKSLFSNFVICKVNNRKEERIAQFSLTKKVTAVVPTPTIMQQTISSASTEYILLIEPTMHYLNRIVVEKISAVWEDVAYALEYDIQTVECISCKHNGDPMKCCKELFKNWLVTNSGTKPKTWQTLLSKLKEIDKLTSVAQKIKEELIKMDSQYLL